MLPLPRILHAFIAFLSLATAGLALFCVVVSISIHLPSSPRLLAGAGYALSVLVVAGAAWAVWKRVSCKLLLAVLCAVGVFLTYLAYDAPRSTPAPQERPLVPADSPSYAAYRGALKTDASPSTDSPAPALPDFPAALADWPQFVAEHRAVLDTAWTNDDFARVWIDAMAAHAPEGLYPPSTYIDPYLDFAALRRAMQLRWSRFHLLVADGQTNEAARSLLPALRAGYNFQKGATNMINHLYAALLLKGAYERLALIADAPGLAPETRAAVAETLALAPSMDVVFANVIWGEQVFARSYMDAMQRNMNSVAGSMEMSEQILCYDGSLRRLLTHTLRRFLFNPHHTERLYVDYLDAIRRHAQNREWDQVAARGAEFKLRLSSFQFKNPAGRLLISFAIPIFGKPLQDLWATEDLRLALLQSYRR